MYAAVKRSGLDRASKKDIAYCIAWLRENGWRRVEKRLPDGQRVRVWRAPGPPDDSPTGRTQAAKDGWPLAEKEWLDSPANDGQPDNVGDEAPFDVADVADVAAPVAPKVWPSDHLGGTIFRPKTPSNQPLTGRHTQTVLSEVI
jgi:hypothetical protein